MENKNIKKTATVNDVIYEFLGNINKTKGYLGAIIYKEIKIFFQNLKKFLADFEIEDGETLNDLLTDKISSAESKLTYSVQKMLDRDCLSRLRAELKPLFDFDGYERYHMQACLSSATTAMENYFNCSEDTNNEICNSCWLTTTRIKDEIWALCTRLDVASGIVAD